MECFWGKAPLDQVVKSIGDFIYIHSDHPNLEIEAKFGEIQDSNRQRISLPVLNEVVLHDSYFKSHGFRFVSDISRDQHANFNQSLNKRVEECANTMRKYRQSLASSSSNNNDQPADTHKQVNGSSPPPVISYKHIKESDEFFEMQDEATGQRFTARASRDKATDKVIRMIVKRPIADLHLHFPYAPFDCRLTLSCENPIKIPSTMPQLLFTREKDRISYRSADGFCIDLTQVRKRNQITHELELEMTDVERVLAEKSRLASGLPNEFSGIIGKLVANIRAIVVKSSVITAAAAAAAATSSSSSYSNSVGANHARPNTSGNNGNGNDGDDDNRLDNYNNMWASLFGSKSKRGKLQQFQQSSGASTIAVSDAGSTAPLQDQSINNTHNNNNHSIPASKQQSRIIVQLRGATMTKLNVTTNFSAKQPANTMASVVTAVMANHPQSTPTRSSVSNEAQISSPEGFPSPVAAAVKSMLVHNDGGSGSGGGDITAAQNSSTVIETAATKAAEENPIKAVYRQLSQMNEQLLNADVATHLSLFLILQQKFGIGAQLTAVEMRHLQSRVAAINSLYREFANSIQSAVRLRIEVVSKVAATAANGANANAMASLTEKDQTTTGSEDRSKSTTALFPPIAGNNSTPVTPAMSTFKALQRSSSNSSSRRSSLTKITAESTRNSVHCPVNVECFPPSRQQHSGDIAVMAEQPTDTAKADADDQHRHTNRRQHQSTIVLDLDNLEARSIDESELRRLLELAQMKHAALLNEIDQIKRLVDERRLQIDPQAIINAQTEHGHLQRFYVRLRYKEMVKGCCDCRPSPSKTVDYLLAGSGQAGDYWLNELLKLYWRHFDPQSLPPDHSLQQQQQQQQQQQPLKLATNTTSTTVARRSACGAQDEQADSASRRRSDYYSLTSPRQQQQSTRYRVFDSAHAEELLSWIDSVLDEPGLYTAHTKELVDTVVEKMGGRKLFPVFIREWLKQFYLDRGKVNLAFPMAGCEPWTPELDSRQNAYASADMPASANFQYDTPKTDSISFKDVLTYGLDEMADDLTLLDSEEGRYELQRKRLNEYTLLMVCREVLTVHEIITKEFPGHAEDLCQWLRAVEESGITTDEHYYRRFIDASEDSMLNSRQKALLHPKLVEIREKAIVLNACFEPQRFEYLQRIDEQLRCEFSGDNKWAQGVSAKPYSAAAEYSARRTQTMTPPANQQQQQQQQQQQPSISTGSMQSGSNVVIRGHKKSASAGGFLNSFKHRKQLSMTSTTTTTTTAMSQKTTGSSLENVVSNESSASNPPSNSAAPTITTASATILHTGSEAAAAVSKQPAIKLNRPRFQSLPTSSADNLFKPSYLGEIRKICFDIMKYQVPLQGLADRSLLYKLNETSAAVVKNFLSNELPAKYQSFY